ncbi:Rieske 2Fe-2S domain-containing protein [Alteromonas sp. MMG017]|uniref:aromatic ring-hydroxylating dioxygenase subunit alpha n=1 Tax=Alteromonas sp. MMG017 TaxID=2822692 RepID=UPI001B3A53D3|nr:aromatic ring-hydroxylating dioxygenase subunit alpha [Alteromonas sp. MMG017]MBQ4828445.1 Rieske 2Fe-2S domain-containing protein [Alteromonas sp. MMG017]
MYPFKYKTSIVRNRWYMAAFSNEISREPIERTFLSKPVVMYRKQDGTPVAMYGLCPHRYFSLVKGRVEGDNIVCGYHGFKFADNGDCIEIPSQDTVPRNFCQPVYPLEERGPICWIWMGDLEKCDTNLIPPYHDIGLDNSDSYYSSENYFHVEGRSQLLVDNLMDLTHLPYIHQQLGKGGDTLKKIPMETLERDESYRVLRKGKMPWNPFLETIYGKKAEYEGLADFVHLSDFYGPELVKTSIPSITKIPGRDGVPKELGHMAILHGLTPETETTTHYFGFSTRNFRQGDKTLDKFQYDSEMQVRQQDVDAIEDMEKRIDQAALFQRELIVGADKAAIQARRKVDAMLAAENAVTGL